MQLKASWRAHLQDNQRERSEECDDNGVFGLAHIKKKIEEAVAEAQGCEEAERKNKVAQRHCMRQTCITQNTHSLRTHSHLQNHSWNYRISEFRILDARKPSARAIIRVKCVGCAL